MKFYWKIFWLSLAVLLGLIVIVGCAVAAYQKSVVILYQTIRLVFTAGSGVCGVVALIAVPIDLYLEDKRRQAL
jgi:hypothetical protein